MPAGDVTRDFHYLTLLEIDDRITALRVALIEAECFGSEHLIHELRAELIEAGIAREAHVPKQREPQA